MKDIGKTAKRALLCGKFNWLIWVFVGGCLYGLTNQIFWLIFGISFGVVFQQKDFLGKKDKKKDE